MKPFLSACGALLAIAVPQLVVCFSGYAVGYNLGLQEGLDLNLRKCVGGSCGVCFPDMLDPHRNQDEPGCDVESVFDWKMVDVDRDGSQVWSCENGVRVNVYLPNAPGDALFPINRNHPRQRKASDRIAFNKGTDK